MEMTPRQWLLYKYIKDHYQEGVFISKHEIAKELNYPWNDKSDRNGRDIESDVYAINKNETIYKIIISCSKGYKIASKEEAGQYLLDDWQNIIKKIQRHNKIRAKAQLHGQMRIVWNQERDTIEAFIDKE